MSLRRDAERTGHRAMLALAMFTGACRDRNEPVAAHRVTASPSAPAQNTGILGHLRSDGGSFVEHQLSLRVAQFGGTLVPVGPIERGSLAQGATASHDLEIIANHCYRVLAVGGVEVNDLELALFGPDGSELDTDTGGSDYPALGTTRPICPPTSGHDRVEVRMRAGQGEYGLVVLRTP